MTWVLGIDFGTSYTTAAICANGRPEPIEIDGQRRMPSVILVDEDGSIVVGSAAERLSATRPGRTLREPKRRLGEPTPVVLGGEPYSVINLVGALLASVYAEAVRHQGGPPTEIRLTHPASWGRPRLAELRRAAAIAGMPNVTLIPEPVAAAVAYANDSPESERGYVAVYDLGGGTFDTAILRHTNEGFTIQGRPGGDARLGGELFDELLAQHVTEQLTPEAASAIVASDELSWRQAAANLRSEARNAKETLSTRDYAELLVALPTGLTQVRVTRADLEGLITDYIDESVDLLARAVADAGMAPGELTAIYVTGGASRAPMIEERLRAAFPGVVVSRRNDPKMVIALGATLPEAAASLDITREMAVVDEPTVMKGTIVSTVELPVDVPPPVPPPSPLTIPEPDGTAVDVASATIEAPEAGGDGTRVDSGTMVDATDGRTVVEPETPGFPPSTDPARTPYPTPVPMADVTDSSQRLLVPTRRRATVIGAAVVALALAIGGIAVAMSGGDAKDTASGSGSKTSNPGAANTVSAKSVKFDRTALSSGVTVDRQWKLSGDQGETLTSTLKMANPTGKDQLASYEEIIPKEIAANASQLKRLPGTPTWTVVKADPIIRYDLGVTAGRTVTLGYTVKVPADGASLSRLKGWIDAYNKAAQARDQEKKVEAYIKALDQDGDGVKVPDDACPDQAAPGVANGCPAPAVDPDADHDGIPIPTDKCPSNKATGTKDGCPRNVTPTTPTVAPTAPPPTAPPPTQPPPAAPTVYITGPNPCALNTNCYWYSHVSGATSGTWSSNCGGSNAAWPTYTSYYLNAYNAGTCVITLSVTGPGGTRSASFNTTFS